MNIQEYSDVIQKEIKITYYPNQKGRWTASFKGAEMLVSNGFALLSNYGEGLTPLLAMEDYLFKIIGHTLVFGAYTDKRQEYGVPTSITLE